MRRSMRKRKAPTHFDPDAAGIPSKPAPAPQQAPVPQPAPVMPQPVPAPQPDPAAVVPAPVGIEHPQEATDPGNQHNDTDEKLTVENVRKKLKEKRQVLHLKRMKRETKYSNLRTQIETMYSQIIKKEEENLKQLEKEEKKENINTIDPGMSKVKEKKKVLNEDKKLKYYRIKRKILGVQRESREMAVQLEIAELEDEYGGEEEVENTDHQLLVSQEEYHAERQFQFSLEEYSVVDQLRTEIDDKEEMLETKMKWVETYLEQQRNKGDKCKWFIPIYDVCLLSKHPSENSKGPQNKGGVIHKLTIQEAMEKSEISADQCVLN